MSYGLEIRNGSQRIILDDTYSNWYLTTSTPYTASRGASWPPPGVDDLEDMVLAAPAVNSDGFVGIDRDDNPANDKWLSASSFYDVPTSFRYYVAKKYTDNTFSSSLTYGLEVKNPNGDLLFMPPEIKSFDVINYCDWPGADADLVFPGEADLYTDFQDYYVMLNGNTGQNLGVATGAEFIWDSSTTGRIHLTTKNGRYVRTQRLLIAKIRG